MGFELLQDVPGALPEELWHMILLFLTMVEGWKNMQVVCKDFFAISDAWWVYHNFRIFEVPDADGRIMVVRPCYMPAMLAD